MKNIITRGDFDGLVCCVLLTEAEDISEVKFAHPQQMQAGETIVGGQDIIVNLPYSPGCGMWFDHHISESEKGPKPGAFEGAYGLAPSCARLVYDHYNMPEWGKYSALMDETDKIDSAQLTLNDILRPAGWVRISNTVDPRTGFVPSYDYFMNLVEWIKEHSLEEILQFDGVRDRVREFFEQERDYKEALTANSELDRRVVVTDFRKQIKTPVGSRFLIYALFPAASVSVRVFYTEDQSQVTIAVGKSILNKTCPVDVGNLMAEYGGGGHVGAGSCRVSVQSADDAIGDITERLNSGV